MIPLKLENVTKEFGDRTAVDGISLEVEQGEIFGLLGGNGAGKTTTMRMVLGIIHPDAGRIRWKGQGYSPELIQMMGYLPEERGLYPKVSVSEQIVYLAKLRGMSKREAERGLKYWLERFEVPEYYDRKVEELSKGNQQKIQFIAAIIHRPELLVLDEAFSGLDPVNVELLKSTVRELRDQGTSILFSTHRMEHVEELCQNICILHKSKTVLKGSLREIKASFPKEKAVLRTEKEVADLDRVPGVRSVEKKENGLYLLKIENAEAGQEVLRIASRQTAVLKFEIPEPTMNEIFIRSVGEHIE